AMADFEAALAIAPGYAGAHFGRAHSFAALRQHDEAAKSYAAGLAIDENLPYALGHLAFRRGLTCDWTDYGDIVRRIRDGVRGGRPVCIPLALLSLTDSPGEQLACACSYTGAQFPLAAPVEAPTRSARRKIRLAYLSANYNEHAVAYLIAE